MANEVGDGFELSTEHATPPPQSGVSRRELADALGVHMMTVTKWERDGMPLLERGRRGRASRYDVNAVRSWMEARERAARTVGLIDVAQERARKERAQAVLAEQTFQVRSRQLLPVSDVERGMQALVTAVRTGILTTYITDADRVYQAAMKDGVAGVERELKAIAFALLRELATHGDPEKQPAA